MRVCVVAGGFHSLLLTAKGALLSSDNGAYGQLGHGDKTGQPRPKRVEALDEY